jgi:hypothetical protein
MSVAATPLPRIQAPPPATQVLPVASYDGMWIGYEAALPWIRMAPPLLARTPVQPR